MFAPPFSITRRLGMFFAGAATLTVMMLTAWVTSANAIPTDPNNPNYPPCLANTTAWMTVSPTLIAAGSSTTLSWGVNVPHGCPALTYQLESRLSFNVFDTMLPASASGSTVVYPSGNTSWTLHAVWGPGVTKPVGGTAVAVQLPQESGGPAVTIISNTQKGLFLQAIGTENVTIRIQNHVHLDLSYLDPLLIAPGVQILGGRSSTEPGPRLFTTTHPRRLFVIGEYNPADGVRISGVRLEGAELGIADEDTETSNGITVISSVNVEIDNNDISGWRGAAVQVEDPRGQINLYPNPTAVRVHDNYIHHNQHYGKNGYGVVLGPGAYALIEQNVFNYNRHAIAANGSDGTGYLAYRNLVFKSGGVNSAVTHTHQFDMHGTTEDCWLFPIPYPFHLYCGQAGEFMDIRFNTILYTNGTGFKVRGRPTKGAEVAHNVFAHSQVWGGWVDDAALAQTQGDNLEQWDNQFGLDTTDEGGWCDFNGDGVTDWFLATGATWWYLHLGQTTGADDQWVYLNTSTRRMADLTLGDVDGDGLCDVTAADGTFYRGGTGKPLQRTDVLWRDQADRTKFHLWRVRNGVITSGVPQQAPAGWQFLGSGDFDADGESESLWRDTSFVTDIAGGSANGIFYMKDGIGVPAGAVEGGLGSMLVNTRVQGIGDFDGDGFSDILWRHPNGQLEIWFKGLGLHSMIPSGQNRPGMAMIPSWHNGPGVVDMSWQVKGVGDFNGDGYADILWRHVNGQVSIWLMAADKYIGTFYPGSQQPARWAIQGVGDFDADGRADILWRDATGALAIWFKGSKAGAAYPQYVPGANVGLDWEIQGVSDFNADGRSDILWRQTGGQVAIWLMHGGQIAGDVYPALMPNTWQMEGLLPVSSSGGVDMGLGPFGMEPLFPAPLDPLGPSTLPHGFALAVDPESGTVAHGGMVTVPVTVTSIRGSIKSVSLTVSGLPRGVTGALSPQTVFAGGTATLTLTVGEEVSDGVVPVTIVGNATEGAVTDSVTYMLVITDLAK